MTQSPAVDDTEISWTRGKAGKASDEEHRSTSRVYALDLVRLSAMLLMMQGHTLDALVAAQHLDVSSFPWSVWHFFRGLTAPIFLMVSGAVHVFANKRDADGRISDSLFARRLRWGITLVGIGYLMTFPAERISDLPFLSSDVWTEFFRVNILQVTGAALIALMILVRFTRSTRSFARAAIITGLVITLSTPLTNAIDWFGSAPVWLAQYLTYAGGSIFPFFPFAAYLFFGVGIGKVLQDTPPEQRLRVLCNRVWLWGVALAAAALLIEAVPVTIFPESTEWRAGPTSILLRVGLTLIFMSIVARVYRRTSVLQKHYSLLGGKALHIYVLHLLLLFGTPWWPGIGKVHYKSFDLAEGFLAAFVIIGLCIAFVYASNYIKRNSRRIWRTVKYSTGALVLYFLLF